MLTWTKLEANMVQFSPLSRKKMENCTILKICVHLSSADNAVLSWLTSGNRKKINEANRKSCLRSLNQEKSKKFFLILKLEVIPHRMPLRRKKNHRNQKPKKKTSTVVVRLKRNPILPYEFYLILHSRRKTGVGLIV